jgi:hypothetical protein
MKPILDTILSFTVSKKLLVFLISTFLVWRELLTSEQWVSIALMYIGTQGAIDLFSQIFNIFKK